MLFLSVDNEDGVGYAVEVRDTAQVPVELLQLTAVAQGFTLGHVLKVARALHGTQFNHALHTTGHGREVGQHSTEPALVYKWHSASLGVVRNRALRLLLGADEQNDAASRNEVTDVGVTRLDAGEGLSKVNQIDSVALAENKATHFRVPTTGLVPEVHSRVK